MNVIPRHSIRFLWEGRIRELAFPSPDYQPTTLLSTFLALPGQPAERAQYDRVLLAEPSPGGNIRFREVQPDQVMIPQLLGKELITSDIQPDSDTGTLLRRHARLQKLNQVGEILALQGKDEKYFIPFTMDQAVSLISAFPESWFLPCPADSALNPQDPPVYIDLSHVDALSFYFEDHAFWFVGSALPLEDLKETASDRIAVLYPILESYGSISRRHLLSLAGAFTNQAALGDLLNWLLQQGSRVHLMQAEGNQVLPLETYLQKLKEGHEYRRMLMTMVSIPKKQYSPKSPEP